ncbi:MAG: tyrosine-type recombinase/integrase [Firmicutes bacterium]|nr:tyrosine-type recombinase/integrase [Bacillota bacterium]
MNAIKKVISARHPLWGDNVPIFCSKDGREMTPSTWGHEFKKCIRRKNLDDTISPYDLRHTFAIMFLRNGGNLLFRYQYNSNLWAYQLRMNLCVLSAFFLSSLCL